MLIIAIDPGPVRSALVGYNDEPTALRMIAPNAEVLAYLKTLVTPGLDVLLAVEMCACYGMPVGAEVFQTVLWTGRYIEAWGGNFRLVYRSEVKMHLCHTMRAKDPNIRQALIDKFGPVGTKREPGLLYGYKADLWAALAVAVTAAETACLTKD